MLLFLILFAVLGIFAFKRFVLLYFELGLYKDLICFRTISCIYLNYYSECHLTNFNSFEIMGKFVQNHRKTDWKVYFIDPHLEIEIVCLGLINMFIKMF